MQYLKRLKGRLDPYFLVGILVVAGILRIVYLAELSGTTFFRYPVLDAEYYFRWGSELALGGVRVLPGFQGNPLYPYFLAFLIRFAQAGPLLIRIVQHGLGVITCLLIFRSGTILFGRKTGLVAALFYAIYIPAIFYEGWFLSASLTAFLAAALLSSLLTAQKDFQRGRWLGCGLLAGLLILARPTLLPFGVLLWIIFAFKKRAAGRWVRPLLFLAGIMIIIAPAALYFSRGRGVTGFISSHGGENFYIGNNPGATGAGRIPDFARGTPALQHDDFLREATRRTGQALSPEENSRFWFREGIRFVTGHPGAFLKLLVLKIYLFFSANAVSDNYHLPFFRNQLPILRLPFGWHALSALGILGMIAGWKRRKSTALLYILTGCYIASISLFFVTGRFRLPAAPFFALFGAFGVISIYHALREKREKTAAGLIITAGLIFFGLGQMPEATPIYASYLSAGEIYYRDGDYAHALSYLVKARDAIEEPGRADKLHTYRIHYGLGQAYLGLNQPVRAAEEFQKLGRESPRNLLEPEFDIGNAYAAHKFYREAKDRYLAVLKIYPDHFRTWNNLGMVYREEEELEEAENAFKEAIRINTDYAAPHVNLGNLYVQDKRFEAALEEFQAALRIDPTLGRLHLSTAFCLQKLNRLAEAGTESRRCPAAMRESI